MLKEEKLKTAIALKYPENSPAPFIVAKGKGKLAEYIINEAKKNDVNVVSDTSLVEFLDVEEIGNYIPEETWNAVAAIFSFMYSETEKRL